MDAEQTIERIKKLEEMSKREIEKAEAEKNNILKKASEDALVLIDNFEKTKETHIQEWFENAEKEIKKEAAKIIAKAEKDAEELRKKASQKVTPVSNELFEDFKKRFFSAE